MHLSKNIGPYILYKSDDVLTAPVIRKAYHISYCNYLTLAIPVCLIDLTVGAFNSFPFTSESLGSYA